MGDVRGVGRSLVLQYMCVCVLVDANDTSLALLSLGLDRDGFEFTLCIS